MESIEDLLKSMQTKYKASDGGKSIKSLENSKATWEKIGNGSIYDELDLDEGTDKEKFLKDWIAENPYSNLD